MKKILLIIAITLCIFQMVVLAEAIDIGSPVIDRGNNSIANYTYIDVNNPANGSGKITSVEIYAHSAMSSCVVATFYVVSGNNLTARDHELIGDVAVGYNQFDININVEAEDCIGIYNTTGTIDYDVTGDGFWYKSGDNTTCVDTTFSFLTSRMLSLYGTGTTVAAGIKWNGVTITKWNGQVITKWNGLE